MLIITASVEKTPNTTATVAIDRRRIRMIVEEVDNAIALYRADAKTRWIAANKFERRHSFFVLDLNNVEYEYKSAHTYETCVPVYVLQLSRAPKIFRHKPQDQDLAEKLAQMHDLHGK
ncbi:uncharacterized protein N7459_006513 [Penicillium hispanicum]|uniref:uncharacterized protein n=1 Tax=Penicillium hispanicum TaxID=1080232 RepID=UPI002540BEE0|nr:uncharacterized protein N7459_006513 [Penicillium hispanicum]KAJ5577549.1 hypothetical protein N7459_006513 [Penicillium hispanicum]